MMKEAFYFTYGKSESSATTELTQPFAINLDKSDGGGIAIRKGYEVAEFKPVMKFSILSYEEAPLTIRVEKKFNSNTITQKYLIRQLVRREITVNISKDELKDINEIVVSVLKEDNPKVTSVKYTLSVEEA